MNILQKYLRTSKEQEYLNILGTLYGCIDLLPKCDWVLVMLVLSNIATAMC